VEHEIELQAGQAQISANLFLIVFSEIETEERLDVPLVGHFFQYLPNDISAFLPQQFFELIVGRVGKCYSLFGFSQSLPPRSALEALYDPVSGHATNEPRNSLCLPDVSPSDLFNDNTESLLVKIISDRRVSQRPADDAHYGAIIALDQFSLSLPIAAPNAADEIGPAASPIHSHGFHSLTWRDL
jgi:hypothetical protein